MRLTPLIRWLRRVQAVYQGSPKVRVVGRVDSHSIGRLWFDNQELTAQVLSEIDVDSFGSVSSVFHRCDFSGLRAQNASFGAGQGVSRYVECTFDRARISHSLAGRARFERCSLRDVRLGEFWAHDAEFVDCVFSGSIRKAIFRGRPLSEATGRSRNEFTGNDFTGAYLHDVAFRGGVDLAAQHLPSGANYLLCVDGRRALARAKERLAEFSAAPDYPKATGLAQMLAREIEEGQEQLFLCLGSLPRSPGPALEAVLKAL